MYSNSVNLFFKRKNEIVNRYSLIGRVSIFFFAPGPNIPESGPGAGSGMPLNDMSCRKKAEFYVRIQLHSDGTTWLQSHNKDTAGRNTVHVAPCDRLLKQVELP